jgi:hypothetical protein
VRKGWKADTTLVQLYGGIVSFFSLLGHLQKVPSVLRFLYVQRIKGFEPPPRRPWVDDATAEWLTCQLENTKLFVEFGSGGSTVLANDLEVPTISVESDRFYAAAVRRALKSPHICQILTPRMGITGEWGMPFFFRSAKGFRYASAPFRHLGGRFPDLILIDGRYRVACALESARQAAEACVTATLLLDDYSERPHYHELENYLGIPERIGAAAKFIIGRAAIQTQEVRRHSRDAR